MGQLSQENIDKLCLTGIYRCDPVVEWLSWYKRDTPYHCCNWTFKVEEDSKEKGIYYMVDTYWSTGDSLTVRLTDEIFDKFEFLFDLEDVRIVRPPDFYDYNENDRWHVALDSGGYQHSKYWFVRKDAVKDRDKLIKRLYKELGSLKTQVRWKREEIRKVLSEGCREQSTTSCE